MSAGSLTVMPILATPLGIASIPDAHRINAALPGIFAQRIAADARPQDPLRFCSGEDLMEWDDAPVRSLTNALVSAVFSLVSSVSEITEAQLRSFRLESRAWFTVIRGNGNVPATNFPMTAWCAIYCVAAPAAAERRADSGVVRLYESRLGSAFQDATSAAMRIPYRQSHYAWRPEAGKMIVFPASLTHEVALLRSADELILVTARIRFVAPGQQGFARW